MGNSVPKKRRVARLTSRLGDGSSTCGCRPGSHKAEAYNLSLRLLDPSPWPSCSSASFFHLFLSPATSCWDDLRRKWGGKNSWRGEERRAPEVCKVQPLPLRRWWLGQCRFLPSSAPAQGLCWRPLQSRPAASTRIPRAITHASKCLIKFS